MANLASKALRTWIPYSMAGAAVSAIVGFVFHLPMPQVLVSAGMTAGLIFSGMAMHSQGRGKEQQKAQ
jgi:hypothetical protein